ncbi:hypothetical protein EK21DRAFT_117772 [Setomelanomma holmii]|uniref:Major facilitator superfamily (MFS) profile domain-containing protein n=1 Tax=Setomelanomma holmii TaxID=210430 RepID=A0A9P4GZK2_9PLEO|nr:hypothetical protein EK21DRAFT_117772 [Setomelanomma holmii]
MASSFERRHVSKMIPADHRILMPLLLAVTIVNSATLGYDSSVMNGLLILPSYSEYFHLNTATEGLNNAAILVILCTFGPMISMFGNFIISYYLGKILTQAGITKTQTQTQVQVIINCWSFAVAILGSLMLDILGRRVQTFIGVGGMAITLLMIGGLISVSSTDWFRFGGTENTSGIYATIAVIFLFQGFYAFSITPMTSLYPTEVLLFKLRATGIAVFRMFDSGFGLLASFTMAYAMADLGWKFYFINTAWDFVFLVIAYFSFVETKGLTLEDIAAKFEGSTDVIFGVDDGSSVGEVGKESTKQDGIIAKTQEL